MPLLLMLSGSTDLLIGRITGTIVGDQNPPVGDTIEIRIHVTDLDTDQPLNPDTLVCTVAAPDGTDQEFTYPDDDHLTQTADGEFALVWLSTTDGQWIWTAETTGIGQGVGDGSVYVRPLQVPDPSDHLPSFPLRGELLELVIGDDYLAANTRALRWSDAGWPDLTGGSVVVVLRRYRAAPDRAVAGPFAGSVLNLATAQLELTKDQTSTLKPGHHVYQVIATLASGAVVTLAIGAAIASRPTA